MDSSVGYVGAFLAGLVSFLSPCVLPLIPAYLSFMTGFTVAELSGATGGAAASATDDEGARPAGPSVWDVLVPSLLFVAGFTIVFIALGATASVLGQFLQSYRGIIEKLAGVLVIGFGVLMLGVIKVPWLYGEARADMARARSFGRGAALVMGMSFAAGWTPCVGPILGSILALAGASASVMQGVALLAFYSLGFAVPFIALGLLMGRLAGPMHWLNRHALTLNRIAGVLLVFIGVLILTGQLSVLAGWMASFIPTLSV